METVSLTPSEFSHALHMAAERTMDSLRNNRTDTLNVKSWDEHFQKHLWGASGELAFSKWQHTFPSLSVREFSGMQADATSADGQPIEVRCRTKPYYDLKVHEKDPDDRIYVLVLGVPPTFEIAGWLWGYEAKKQEWFKDVGGYGRPAFFIPRSELHSPASLKGRA